MPFYLRKSYKSGPIRFNVSKGGIGISAGITGARIGVNRRGAYVHGGRHGLYYRKHLKSGNRTQPENHNTETQDIFTDTGLTYPGIHVPDSDIQAPPHARKKFLSFLLVMLALFLIVTGTLSSQIMGALILTGFFCHQINRKRAPGALQTLIDLVERKESAEQIFSKILPKAPWYGSPRRWFDEQTALLLLEAHYEEEHPFTLDNVTDIRDRLQMGPESWENATLRFFHTTLEQILLDHHISEEEENALRVLANELDLTPQLLEAEFAYIALFSTIRKTVSEELAPLSCPFPRKRNEVCFFMSEGRLLKENVINRFQRQGVRFRELGYETDMEGAIFVTNQRIIIKDSGFRSYDLHRITDVALQLSDFTVRIVLTDRKNPLIFTLPDAPFFTAIIQKILQKT